VRKIKEAKGAKEVNEVKEFNEVKEVHYKTILIFCIKINTKVLRMD
jgi:hypothetical protein